MRGRESLKTQSLSLVDFRYQHILTKAPGESITSFLVRVISLIRVLNIAYSLQSSIRAHLDRTKGGNL
jgi:hypothetical protein